MALTLFPQDVLIHILSFCSWRDFTFLSAHSSFANLDVWREMCSWLSQREFVYIPIPFERKQREYWRTTFKKAFSSWRFSQRHEQVFSVNVLVRIRPAIKEDRQSSPLSPEAEREQKMLPLHQRLQMIKVQHGGADGSLSQKDAMKILWEQVTGAPITKSDPWERLSPQAVVEDEEKEASSSSDDGDLHKKSSVSTQPQMVMIAPESATILVTGATGLREFHFDSVFTGLATQVQVYDQLQVHVASFLNGINSCVFAYGQTGSGKSHTMFGYMPPSSTAGAWSFGDVVSPGDSIEESSSSLSSPSLCSPSASAAAASLSPDVSSAAPSPLPPSVADPSTEAGLIPRACTEIMTALQQRKEQLGVQYSLGASYIEVFGDVVTDLLKQEAVGAWSGVAARSVLEGAALVPVRSQEDLRQILIAGDAAKRRAATMMNERSSRAHSLLLLTLEQRAPSRNPSPASAAALAAAGPDAAADDEQDDSVVIRSNFCFADLGGSEQLKKSKAEGERLREAVNINMGLLSLKNVISALVEKRSHVPFSDSKLTELLRGTLGANSHTAVIVTGSDAAQHMSETVSSLRFAEACSRIENRSKGGVSSAMLANAIETLDRDIKLTQELIRSKERWESVAVFRDDLIDDIATGEAERRLVTKLVGAEEEHALLEQLLQRRKALVGDGRWQ